jgi:hypothetical protein
MHFPTFVGQKKFKIEDEQKKTATQLDMTLQVQQVISDVSKTDIL